MPQIRCKYHYIVAPTQRTKENVEFLLITRLGPDHLNASLPSLLECRSHFRKTLAWASDKTCHHHAPSLRRSAACCGSSQCDTVPTVRLQLTSPFLNSSLHDAAAGRVPYNALHSFPTCVVRNPAGTESGSATKSVSFLFSVEVRSPNVKHGHDSVPPSRLCDHSFD